MGFWPVPDLMKKDIYEIEPRELLNRGIRFVLLDVDNTLAPYTVNEPERRLTDWAHGLRDAGLELFILSNNRGSRPAIFAGALGIGFVGKARKPFTAAAKKCCSSTAQRRGRRRWWAIRFIRTRCAQSVWGPWRCWLSR